VMAEVVGWRVWLSGGEQVAEVVGWRVWLSGDESS
jgi:hypothetical protein